MGDRKKYSEMNRGLQRVIENKTKKRSKISYKCERYTGLLRSAPLSVARRNSVEILSVEQMAEIAEMSEANMYRTMWDSAPPDYAAQYGMSWQEVGGATALLLKALPSVALFNRVVGLGIRQPATETMLDDLIGLYTGLQTVICIPVGPAAQPPQLIDWLLARGFQRRSNLAKMIRGPEPAPKTETDLHVERVDETTAVHAGKIVQSAFRMPDWVAPWFANWVQHPDVYGYLAYAGDMPVGTGGLVVSGEWGSFGAGSTLPEYRRRGAQSALFARRIQDGITLGCRWFTTETGEDTQENPNPSYHNMVRAGFQLAYVQAWYIYEPQAKQGADQ
jgi:hypothetical protein